MKVNKANVLFSYSVSCLVGKTDNHLFIHSFNKHLLSNAESGFEDSGAKPTLFLPLRSRSLLS